MSFDVSQVLLFDDICHINLYIKLVSSISVICVKSTDNSLLGRVIPTIEIDPVGSSFIGLIVIVPVRVILPYPSVAVIVIFDTPNWLLAKTKFNFLSESIEAVKKLVS